jgi:hypothetical protein
VTPELAEALDVLDYLTDEQIATIRAAVESAMRTAVSRRASGARRSDLLAPWSPLQLEIARVLWETSNTRLQESFAKD